MKQAVKISLVKIAENTYSASIIETDGIPEELITLLSVDNQELVSVKSAIINRVIKYNHENDTDFRVKFELNTTALQLSESERTNGNREMLKSESKSLSLTDDLASIASTGVTEFDNQLKIMVAKTKMAEAMAQVVAGSTILSRKFEVMDPSKGRIVDHNAIIANILMGYELGMEPMQAIQLGTTLNADTYLKVLKGREMGLSFTDAYSNIHILDTKNGKLYYTGVSIIKAKILEAGGEFEVLNDYTPVFGYLSLKTGAYLSDELTEDMFLFIQNSTSNESLNKAIDEGKVIVVKSSTPTNYITRIKFTRRGKTTRTYTATYSVNQAKEAGLAKGSVNDKGKDNWNKFIREMLRARCFSDGGNTLFSDVIKNMKTAADAILVANDIEDVKFEEMKD